MPRVLFQVNSSGQAIAIERNHFYATCLKIASLSGETAGEEWREGYADGVRIARQLSLTWQEHGVRHYDPTLGRWNQYEPLADKFAVMSPYVYANNDPINSTDPSGYSAWRDRAQVMQDGMGDHYYGELMRRVGDGGGGQWAMHWSMDSEFMNSPGDASSARAVYNDDNSITYKDKYGRDVDQSAILGNTVNNGDKENGYWVDFSFKERKLKSYKVNAKEGTITLNYALTIVIATKWVGYSMLLFQDFDGAGGLGHVAVGFEDPQGNIKLYSRNGPDVENDRGKILTLSQLRKERGYDRAFKIPISDASKYDAALEFANANVGFKSDYVLIGFDCNGLVCNTLDAAGKKSGWALALDPVGYGLMNHVPNVRFSGMVGQNKGYFIPLK
jgi:RHS repeat-associated protein